MTTPVHSVPPEATVEQAIRVLSQHNISGLPVTTADGALVGILSESDIVRSRPGDHHLLDHWIALEAYLHARPVRRGIPALATESYLKTRVEDLMTRDVSTVSPETPVIDAAGTMLERDINRLPVMSKGVLVGIVTRRDIIYAILIR
jgi:CBS domain-containing protein